MAEPYDYFHNSDRLARLQEEGRQYQKLQQLAGLATDPETGKGPSYWYQPSAGGIQGLMHDNVPDELEFLKQLIAKRQGKLYDDFQFLKHGASPAGQFNLEEDQHRIAAEQKARANLGYSYDPATDDFGPALAWQQAPTPKEYRVEVGQPQIEDPEEMMLKELAIQLRR